jgi:hypothetical protein
MVRKIVGLYGPSVHNINILKLFIQLQSVIQIQIIHV